MFQVGDLTQEIAEISSKFSAKEQEVKSLSLHLAESKSKVEMIVTNYVCIKYSTSSSNL